MTAHSGRNHPVAITGASGFIGRGVAEHLVKRGISVVALSRAAGVQQHPMLRQATVCSYDAPDLARHMLGANTVLHLADRADRRSYNKSSVDESSVTAINVARQAVAAGAKILIVASSIYANDKKSYYGLSKRLVEDRLLSSKLPLIIIILRLPPVYGFGCKGMLTSLARLTDCKWPLPFGLGNAPRRFLALENLADLVHHLAITDPKTLKAGIYEPADPSLSSLANLSQMLTYRRGRPARLVPIPMIDLISRRTIIAPAAAAENGRRLETGLGWSPPFETIGQLACFD